METGEALQEKKKGEKDDSSSRGHFFAICPHQTLYSYIGVYIDSFSEKREPGENPFFFVLFCCISWLPCGIWRGPMTREEKRGDVKFATPHSLQSLLLVCAVTPFSLILFDGDRLSFLLSLFPSFLGRSFAKKRGDPRKEKCICEWKKESKGERKKDIGQISFFVITAEVWITATFHSDSHPSSVRMLCVCFTVSFNQLQLYSSALTNNLYYHPVWTIYVIIYSLFWVSITYSIE